MRVLTTGAALLSLAMVAGACEFGTGAFAPSASAFAKDKPLAWKPIEDALLRVNDAPPKDWGVYRAGRKNEPLIMQIGNRFLLIATHDHRVFELDAAKIEKKNEELLWSPSDRPANPLATSNWVVGDIGAAFEVTVKLDAENAVIKLQLPHPPEVGNLPQQAPGQTRRRNYFAGEK
jgi:hypothetical protein